MSLVLNYASKYVAEICVGRQFLTFKSTGCGNYDEIPTALTNIVQDNRRVRFQAVN